MAKKNANRLLLALILGMIVLLVIFVSCQQEFIYNIVTGKMGLFGTAVYGESTYGP
jgi:hypothetical protein